MVRSWGPSAREEELFVPKNSREAFERASSLEDKAKAVAKYIFGEKRLRAEGLHATRLRKHFGEDNHWTLAAIEFAEDSGWIVGEYLSDSNASAPATLYYMGTILGAQALNEDYAKYKQKLDKWLQ